MAAPPSRSSSPTSTLDGVYPSPVHSSSSTIVHDDVLEIKFETEFGETHIEAYGTGRKVSRHPPTKKLAPSSFLPKPKDDPNLVTWDGPDDPDNPQNWPFWYRWWLTALCTVMTLNVYVPIQLDVVRA